MDNNITGTLTQQILQSAYQNQQDIIQPINQNQQNIFQPINQNQQDIIQPMTPKIQENESIASSNDIGDLSYVQLPYIQNNYNDNEYNDNLSYFYEINNIDCNKEQFSSYVLYFALIIILFGYFGYYVVNNKIIPSESVSGINLGVLIGLIFVILAWSSISNS